MSQKRHLLFLTLCLSFILYGFTSWGVASVQAQTEIPVVEEAPAAIPDSAVLSPEYVSAQVVEVLSEIEVDDQVMDHHNKTVRFKVAFPAYGEQPAHTLELEQSFDPTNQTELYPKAGKSYVFYRESFADGTPEYTLVDVQRFNHIGLVTFLAIVLLVVMGRWYGIKALLLSAGMLAVFFVLHAFGVPWFWKSFLTFIAVVILAPILTFGVNHRAKAAALAAFASGLATLLSIWVSSWFKVTTPAALFNSALILQMGAGLSYISIFSVRSLVQARRQDINLRGQRLYRKAFVGGQTALEGLATLYLIFALGQILTSAYASGSSPGMMELAPVLTEMASLIFMFIGFSLAVPLSAYVVTRVILNKR